MAEIMGQMVTVEPTALVVPAHSLEVFRGTDNQWYWRKTEVGTGDGVGHDGPFPTALWGLREAAWANPEIEIITVNRGSLKPKKRHRS